ncbi:MAG: hypothetical protein M1835_007679 [Candelina submexicana]|nr:MAG: hypothetical protein M1835_007679 [Candelina submexicana]
MARVEVNRFICKLKLIRYGLVGEAEEIDDMHIRPRGVQNGEMEEDVEDDDDDSGSGAEDADDLIERRIRFVKFTTRRGESGLKKADPAHKNEAVAVKRRAVIKEFMTSMTKPKKCANCQGISPGYRKVKSTKIFRKENTKTAKAHNIQGGYKEINPLILRNRERRVKQHAKQKAGEVDEGIVADIDDMSLEEEEEEEEEEAEEDEGLTLGTDGALPTDTGHEMEARVAVKAAKSKQQGKDTYVSSVEVHALLVRLFEKESEIMSLVYNSRVPSMGHESIIADMFFVKDILVPPNRYRPEARTGDEGIAEAQQNSTYKQILQSCGRMNDITREMKGLATDLPTRSRGITDLENARMRLQDAVNSLVDRSLNPIQGAAGKANPDGIKQLLERKDGLFRKNMMGKRVNFAARSVISPDPNIETNEIGVPPVFAKKLTYPEPVTNHNFYDLKEAVLNGVDKWPGAAAIENETGQIINLRTKNFEERQALANQLLAPSSTNVSGARNKKVHRHLNNGDVVIMNRQPTLHKPSMMGHRARVLPGEKTIRMHYANCNTYNADFDGDEMNMHFPQSEVSRAEALQIADTDHQYLVATSGKPLRGLIQDHISICVYMTNRDTFFNHEEYQQLLYSCLRPEDNHTTSDRILTIEPAILKPRPMWTGKQIVSTILLNIKPFAHPGLTLTSNSKTGAQCWGTKFSEEATVMFQDGELLMGILDKAQIGPTAGGLIHSIHEVYGHNIAGRLLSVLGRLLTRLLNMRAFSCGMEDITLTKQGDQARMEKLRRAGEIGLNVAAKYVTLEDEGVGGDNSALLSRLEDVFRDDSKQAGLDNVVTARNSALSSEITTTCLPAGLLKPFPRNQMQAMTETGAKGSPVNANLISCNLGQQVLEGRRVPIMVSGKSLPCFKPFEPDIRAGGYITGRFLTGIRPQEYFFHAMAGREGLIDTAVKTSRSGYLQRCLIKGMEGLKVEYDDSVRDSDGSLVQFLYGEDGVEVTKSKHLTDFKFLAENFLSLFAELSIREEYREVLKEEPGNWCKEAIKMVRSTGRLDAMDPALAHYQPDANIGSVSEKFARAMKKYCEKNPDKLLRDRKKGVEGIMTKKTFNSLLEMKYLKAIVEPGEAVGVMAGQSVGEPSTQMTLNTFHLAGHSAKNVTLGIPRLREIVMTASNSIKTPVMTLHMIPELPSEAGDRFAKALSKLTLAELVDDVTVTETVGPGIGYSRAKIYKIRINLFPTEEYCVEYAIKRMDVITALERKFVPRLQKMIRQELKKKGEERSLKASTKSDALPQIGQSSGIVQQAPSRPEGGREGGDDDEDDNGDDDATNTRQRQNRTEAISYEAPDEEEEEVQLAAQEQFEALPEALEDEGFGGSPKESEVDGDEAGSDGSSPESTSVMAKAREQRVMTNNEDVTSFKFDYKSGQWCEVQLEYDAATAKLLMLSLVESACHRTIVQFVPGVGTCTLSSEKVHDPTTNTEIEYPIVITEGVNLIAMRDYQDIINPNKLFTNDIAGFLTYYGVEACRNNIVREVDAVFQSHGITVDQRHLGLIADMMTRGGGFSAFNRTGIKSSSVSPFMKMSFETTIAFLKDAALEEDWDDLAGPSARISVGKVSNVGTGCFDLYTQVGKR